MSDLPEPEELETRQVPVWRFNADWYHHGVPMPPGDWKESRDKDLQEARDMLAHLEEGEDWFFVQVYGSDVDVFFIDPREAMLFKLRHVM
jgi:hypothetical protein